MVGKCREWPGMAGKCVPPRPGSILGLVDCVPPRPGSIFGRQTVFRHVRGHFQSAKEEKEIDLVVA